MIKKRERKVFSIFSHFQIGVDSARVDGFFSWVKLLLSGVVIPGRFRASSHRVEARARAERTLGYASAAVFVQSQPNTLHTA